MVHYNFTIYFDNDELKQVGLDFEKQLTTLEIRILREEFRADYPNMKALDIRRVVGDNHYLFEVADEDSELDGEEFLVGAPSLIEATAIAERVFSTNVEFVDVLTEFEAENSGLDEY